MKKILLASLSLALALSAVAQEKIKLSELPVRAAIADGDVLPMTHSGTTYGLDLGKILRASAANLDLYSTAMTTMWSPIARVRNDAGDAILSFFDAGAQEWVMGHDQADGSFKIADGTALGTNPRLTIDSLGRIGLGTASPSHELHVAANSGGATGAAAPATIAIEDLDAGSAWSVGEVWGALDWVSADTSTVGPGRIPGSGCTKETPQAKHL